MEETKPTPALLEQIPLFFGLAESALTTIAAQMTLEHRRRGESLAGRTPQTLARFQSSVYFVVRGVFSAYTVTTRGSRNILFFRGPGSLLNQNVLHTKPAYLYGEAITDGLLLRAPQAAFSALVCQTPCLMQALLQAYEVDLWRMSHQLKNTAGYLSTDRKVAIKLSKLAREFGVSRPEGLLIPFPLTITQMAEFVGLPRETVSRACKKLKEWGLLLIQSHHFCLTHPHRLAAYGRTGVLEEPQAAQSN